MFRTRIFGIKIINLGTYMTLGVDTKVPKVHFRAEVTHIVIW